MFISFYRKNLCFDLLQGSISNIDGSEVIADNGVRTGYVKVIENIYFNISISSGYLVYRIAYYDSNFIFLTSQLGGDFDVSVQIPTNCEYIRVVFTEASYAVISPDEILTKKPTIKKQ